MADRPENPQPRKLRLRFRSGADFTAGAREMLGPGLAEREAAQARLENPEPGDVMPDGSVFAGISPDTGARMFVTPRDTGLSMIFNDAAAHALDLCMQKALGRADWRLPSDGELLEIYAQSEKGALAGTFDTENVKGASWYWSSTESKKTRKKDAEGMRAVRFSDGTAATLHPDGSTVSVRCLRTAPVWKP